ncbi:MAG: hypothetical protein IPK70_07625 [Flavobacteriales bacterium]|jgi:hypothetical protein|nr:hypothetical protein [Flavobacteriales bacterium]
MKQVARSLIFSASAALVGCGPTQQSNTPADAAEASAPKLNEMVALRAANGQYICADQAEGVARYGALMANRSSIGAWEQFELVPMDSGRFALRASNGKHVCFEREGLRQAVADRDSIGEKETIELVELPEGRVALRTLEGMHLAAQLAEGNACYTCLTADRKDVGAWEAFELIRLNETP